MRQALAQVHGGGWNDGQHSARVSCSNSGKLPSRKPKDVASLHPCVIFTIESSSGNGTTGLRLVILLVPLPMCFPAVLGCYALCFEGDQGSVIVPEAMMTANAARLTIPVPLPGAPSNLPVPPTGALPCGAVLLRKETQELSALDGHTGVLRS